MHFQNSWNENAMPKQCFEILRNVSTGAIKAEEMKGYIHKSTIKWKWWFIRISLDILQVWLFSYEIEGCISDLFSAAFTHHIPPTRQVS